MSTEKKVDVLAVLAYHVETYKRLNRGAKSPDDHIIDIEEAQAAAEVVAELIEASREIQAVLEACTDWDEGCLYYNGISVPELQAPMQNMANAIERVGGAP